MLLRSHIDCRLGTGAVVLSAVSFRLCTIQQVEQREAWPPLSQEVTAGRHGCPEGTPPPSIAVPRLLLCECDELCGREWRCRCR